MGTLCFKKNVEAGEKKERTRHKRHHAHGPESSQELTVVFIERQAQISACRKKWTRNSSLARTDDQGAGVELNLSRPQRQLGSSPPRKPGRGHAVNCREMPSGRHVAFILPVRARRLSYLSLACTALRFKRTAFALWCCWKMQMLSFEKHRSAA